MLCLFSTVSHRVGALQMSIIIKKNAEHTHTHDTFTKQEEKKQVFSSCKWIYHATIIRKLSPVSYTHLTLPTTCGV